MTGIPGFIVVSGLPACGKSTLARALAATLRLALLDKDDFLEARFASTSVSAEDRSRLSRMADEDLRAAAEKQPQAIVVTFWRRRELSATSGTPTEWLAAYQGISEVWCVCDPVVARDRFVARHRHRAHGDRAKDPDEVLVNFERLHDLGPLGLGPVVEVRTDRPVDVADVVRRLGRS